MRGRTGSRGCTIRLRSSSDPCGSQKSYMQRFDLCMSEKASNPRGKRRRNKNRDVRSNRHPRGQTYCCSSTFNPSRPRNEHPVGVRLLAWGEHPPIRTCKRGRGMNRKILHVWLNRRADGLTGRHCDTYEPTYRRKEASRSLTPAGQSSSVSHLRAREDERRRQAVFALNLWKVVERWLAQNKEEKKSERAHDIIANPSRYSPCRASHFTRPSLACSPQLAEKGGPTFLGRGEGLAAVAPSRRGRDKTNGEAVVVVGDNRRWMTSYPA